MKFACDDNLGRLAKYLRLLGFDTFFNDIINNSKLMAIASSEGRLLLTRDTHLTGKSHPYGIMHISEDEPLIQLNMVITDLNIKINTSLIFTRCSRCNEICNPVDKDKIAGRTFPYILHTQKLISECPSCRRLYWKGTHYSRLLLKLKTAIPSVNIIGEWPTI